MNTTCGSRRGNDAKKILLTSIAAAYVLFFWGVGLGGGRDGPPASPTGRRVTTNLAQYSDPKSVELRAAQQAMESEHVRWSYEMRAAHLQEVEDEQVSCDPELKHWKDGRTWQVTVPEFYDIKSGCWHNLARGVAFFNVGRVGGSAVEKELRSNRINVSVNYPVPKQSDVEKLQKGPLDTLVVNVRDPVDRFVSAFRWQLGQLCGPGDPRPKCTSQKIKQESERLLLLREKYNSDPNVFAEALCQESHSREEASGDYLGMWDTRKLSNWLNFLIDPDMKDRFSDDGIQNLIVIPMEEREETSLFGWHVHRMVLELLATRYGRERAAKILMERAQIDDAVVQHNMETLAGRTKILPLSALGEIELLQTSYGQERTKEILNQSPTSEGANVQQNIEPRNAETKAPVLSTLGECCLARHLRGDYHLIQSMLGDDTTIGTVIEPLAYAHPAVSVACSWGGTWEQESCRSDLRSMLTRRARYLDPSVGSCMHVAATHADN